MKIPKYSKPYPPWPLVAGQAPYEIMFLFGHFQHWATIHYLILLALFIPYLLIIISWFIRQRQEEKILKELLKNLNMDTLEALKTFLGDFIITTKPTPRHNKPNKSKQASSTCKKSKMKRGKKHEN